MLRTEPLVGILVTGDEIVDGYVRDENYSIIAQALRARGVRRFRGTKARDSRESYLEALGWLMAAHVVFVTGAMGSTGDDTQVNFITDFTGCPPEVAEDLLAEIEAATQRFDALRPPPPFWERIRQLPSSGKPSAAAVKQAKIPQGAFALAPAPGATSPAYILKVPGFPVIVGLPGPPNEVRVHMKNVLEHPLVREALSGATPLIGHTLRLVGVTEEHLAEVEHAAERRGLMEGIPRWSSCYVQGGAEIRVACACTEEQEPRWPRLVKLVRNMLGDALYSEGPPIGEMLREHLTGRVIGIADLARCVSLTDQLHRIGASPITVAGDEDRVRVLLGVTGPRVQDDDGLESLAKAARVTPTAEIGLAVARTKGGFTAVVTDGERTVPRGFAEPPFPSDDAEDASPPAYLTPDVYASTLVLHLLHSHQLAGQ